MRWAASEFMAYGWGGAPRFTARAPPFAEGPLQPGRLWVPKPSFLNHSPRRPHCCHCSRYEGSQTTHPGPPALCASLPLRPMPREAWVQAAVPRQAVTWTKLATLHEDANLTTIFEHTDVLSSHLKNTCWDETRCPEEDQ